jgi:hypothetical protein
VADARETATRAAETTREWAAPKVEAAREWATPRVEPAVTKVKDDVLPKVAGAVAAAVAASEPAREEARTRGTAAVAALRGELELEPPKPKKHRLRKLFLLTSIAGAAWAGYKAWVAKSGNQPEPWATPISSVPGSSGSSTTGTSTATSPAATTGSATSSSFESSADDGSPSGTGSGSPVAGVVTDDAAGASPDEALADAADESAHLTEATPADMPAAVTETVSPKQSKRAKDAAASDTGGSTLS